MAKEDLISQSERTKEERKKIAIQGGRASGKARRERKIMKEQFEMLLKLPLKNENTKNKIKALGIKDEDINNQMAIKTVLYQKAINGNTKAYEII